MKIYFILTLSILQIYVAFAQYDTIHQYNLHKYWFYRQRFNEQFVRVGSGKGMSLPVSNRANQGEEYFPNGGYNHKHLTGQIHFGDATIHLGHYIGTLATEYYLLQFHYGTLFPQTQETLKELGYAILTFDRLDCAIDGSLNGFFVRDDADASTGALFANPGNPPYEVVSDWKNCNVPNLPNLADDGCYMGIYNSYDQMISLMMGYALVWKFIPIGTTVTLSNVHDPCNPTYIHPFYTFDVRLKVKQITDRIILDFLRNSEKPRKS